MASNVPGSRLSFAFKLVAKSAFRPATGKQRKPVLVDPAELGITFIGHASFLLQLGGLNFIIDPVFAHWLILIHRLRKPGVRTPLAAVEQARTSGVLPKDGPSAAQT